MRKKKLHLSTFLFKFGTDTIGSCFCCRDFKDETFIHVFVFDDRARKVWQLAVGHLDLSITASNVMTMLEKFWNSPFKNIVHI